MSAESYVRGFCKAAEAAGVDPMFLAKFAEGYEELGSIHHPFNLQGERSPKRPGTKFIPLTEQEKKDHFFPSWYSYLNPMNYARAATARKVLPLTKRERMTPVRSLRTSGLSAR